MKSLNVKNYGSVPHLSNSRLGSGDHYVNMGMERILTEKKRDKNDRILAFEKYDGSNVGIVKLDNQIIPITRSGYKASSSPYIQHYMFNDWVYKNISLFIDLLDNGERITGEWMAQAHGLKYNIKSEPILFFDYFNNENKRDKYDLFKQKCDNYGLNTVRLLHDGDPIKSDKLLDKLNEKTDFMESELLPEGIVYRVERNGVMDFMAKWVRSDYIPGVFMMGKGEHELIWNWRP